MYAAVVELISPKRQRSYKYERAFHVIIVIKHLSNSQKTRFRMRQNQINVAKKAGKKHKFQKGILIMDLTKGSMGEPIIDFKKSNYTCEHRITFSNSL